MRPMPYRPARPLSHREQVVLAALAHSLDAVPPVPGEFRRALRTALLTLSVAVAVAASMIALAVLFGAGGFEIAAFGLGTGLLCTMLRDLLRAPSTGDPGTT
jgi:hypothetical protein